MKFIMLAFLYIAYGQTFASDKKGCFLQLTDELYREYFLLSEIDEFSSLGTLESSEEFKKFGKKKNKEYFDFIHSKFTSLKFINGLRKETLNNFLKSRSVEKIDKLRPRESFIKLSAANLNRLLGQARGPESEKIVKLLNEINFSYIHFGLGQGQEKRIIPTLSSRNLEKYTGQFGVNSTSPFTREIIKSDDFVFFLPVPQKKGKRWKTLETPYGDFPYQLSRKYALKNGIVSIYMMTSTNLIEFSKNHYRDVYNLYGKDFDKEFFYKKEGGLRSNPIPKKSKREGIEDFSDVLSFLRGELKLFDFTVSDFEVLVKSVLIKKLSELEAKNKPLFQEVVKKIETGDSPEIDEVFTEYVYNDLFGASSFKAPFLRLEMKIPSIVPANKLKFLQFENEY